MMPWRELNLFRRTAFRCRGGPLSNLWDPCSHPSPWIEVRTGLEIFNYLTTSPYIASTSSLFPSQSQRSPLLSQPPIDFLFLKENSRNKEKIDELMRFMISNIIIKLFNNSIYIAKVFKNKIYIKYKYSIFKGFISINIYIKYLWKLISRLCFNNKFIFDFLIIALISILFYSVFVILSKTIIKVLNVLKISSFIRYNTQQSLVPISYISIKISISSVFL